MSARDLSDHLGYWKDQAKVAGYTAALEEVIKPGDRVLDLGTGTGLLGMLAVKAGAGKVYSVDSGHILGVARDLAKTNGLADRMEFIRGMSTEIELPEVDVIVCDQIGGLAFDAGVLEFFADAKARALTEGGVLMPVSFDLFLVPVEAPGPYSEVEGWDGTAQDLDLGPARSLAANSEYQTQPSEISLLAAGVPIGTVVSSCLAPIKANCTWTVERSGTIHGLSGWFDATLSPSVTLTNNPTDSNRMNRWINFYPIEQPIKVEQGDTVNATIDIRPRGYLVTWFVEVEGQSAYRMSTFAGQYLYDTRTSIVGGARSRSDSDSAGRQKVLRELIALSEVGASVKELVAAAQRHTTVFATDEAAARFARTADSLVT